MYAVYGAVRTVWQGLVGNRRPYADQDPHCDIPPTSHWTDPSHNSYLSTRCCTIRDSLTTALLPQTGSF